MQGIISSLWYDQDALKAAESYVSLFDKAKIDQSVVFHDTPTGDLETVQFTLGNLELFAMSAGPDFRLNPAISLMVFCASREEVDRMYEGLSPGGKVYMPLAEYSFSPWYAWVEDKHGLNWQLALTDQVRDDYKVVPFLLFAGNKCGLAEEAVDFYTETFKDSERRKIEYFERDEAPDPRAKIKSAEINLGGLPLVLIDSGRGGDLSFSEAFSFQVLCDDQEEIDYYWDKMSADPEAEACGWLKDRFGVSWQIVPIWLAELSSTGTREELARVNQALLPMKKIDLAALQEAQKG